MLHFTIEEALTFDDVSLVPNRSSVLPADANLKSRLTDSICLNIPIISAAMDTVTESSLAIALAQEGGVGFIHKNMSLEQQINEVNRVKRYESGVVINPQCVNPDTTLLEVKERTYRNGFAGYPVVINSNELVGIVTSRDVRFINDLSMHVTAVMTPKNRLVTVYEKENRDTVLNKMHDKRVEKVLLVDSLFRLKGMITAKDFEKAKRKPNACKDNDGRLRVGAAVGVGITENYKRHIAELVNAGIDVLLVDSSHGHSEGVLNCISIIRKLYPNLSIIGGNVVTKEGALDLIDAGVNAVKVGIGPGSICTTRIVTGVGIPQITAIANVAKALENTNIPIIADGGIRFSGDIAKAIAAGAHCVMVGSLLAGTEESPGNIEFYQGRSFKSYRGMGSLGAMCQGSADRYFQSHTNMIRKLVPEGIEGRVVYKGKLESIIQQLMGGLRSCMGLTGCISIHDLRKKTKFVRVSYSGMRESHVHDVAITKESPNYRLRSLILMKGLYEYMQHNKHCILVIDFGSQYTQLLLRRIREFGVYSELYDWNVNEFYFHKLKPNGIILSGGPHSVVKNDVPYIPQFVFQLGIPVLGICYGMQIMTTLLGGVVQNSGTQGEFGDAHIKVLSQNILIDGIFDYIDRHGHIILDVWMSHNDVVTTAPKGFNVIGITEYNQVAIIADETRHLYGVQFHPEVTHTKKGKKILKRFVLDVCGCLSLWKPVNIIQNIVINIQKIVGNDHVILAFSGGIDSIVTALLLKIAINNQFICVFVDNGLLCLNEIQRFRNFCEKNHNLHIVSISEAQRFLNALSGVKDPEEKRKIIGKTFIEVFEKQIRSFKHVKWLAQGTIYSDVIESGVSTCYTSQVIKSHHNVGGLPGAINIKLLEPIRHLFKDEVRNIGSMLGLSDDIINRYPFPGPGMAIRILGEVKEKYCNILRQADYIFFEELNREHLYNQVSQAFTVFLPIHSVGIQGDQRTYKWVIALRAIETIDFMTARWARLPYTFLDKVSNRIVNEVSGISRVVYDISSKPPATIEWE